MIEGDGHMKSLVMFVGVGDRIQGTGSNVWNPIGLTQCGETQEKTKMIRFARLKGSIFSWCNNMPILGKTSQLSKQ